VHVKIVVQALLYYPIFICFY